MARKAEWVTHAVEAIREVEGIPGEYIDRKLIERLLQVGPSRAKQLMAVMGAEKAGDALVVPRENFLRYLKLNAAAELEQERIRRKRFAQNLMRKDDPKLMLTAVPVSQAKEVCRGGLRHLPEGISFRPGEIVVCFRDGEHALEQLKKLAMLIADNEEEFHERAKVS